MTAASLPAQRPAVDATGAPVLTDDRGHVYAVIGALWTATVAGHTAIHDGGWVIATQVWTLGALVFGFGAVLTHRKPLP